MHSLSKITNTLKNLPFYSEKIKNFKKSSKKFSYMKLLSGLPFFSKESEKSKKLSNKQLSEALPFLPK